MNRDNKNSFWSTSNDSFILKFGKGTRINKCNHNFYPANFSEG